MAAVSKAVTGPLFSSSAPLSSSVLCCCGGDESSLSEIVDVGVVVGGFILLAPAVASHRFIRHYTAPLLELWHGYVGANKHGGYTDKNNICSVNTRQATEGSGISTHAEQEQSHRQTELTGRRVKPINQRVTENELLLPRDSFPQVFSFTIILHCLFPRLLTVSPSTDTLRFLTVLSSLSG